MKKILSVLIGAIVISVMLFNLEIDVGTYNENDVCLKNISALACYDVDQEGQNYGECCWPWWETCYVIGLGNTLPGEWGI